MHGTLTWLSNCGRLACTSLIWDLRLQNSSTRKLRCCFTVLASVIAETIKINGDLDSQVRKQVMKRPSGRVTAPAAREGKNVGSPISRVLCVARTFTRAMTVIYLRSQLLTTLSNLPESHPSRAGSHNCSAEAEPSLALCLILLRAGFTEPTESPRSLVSSYLTVSPLPRVSELIVRRFTFCCTVPDLTAGRRYRPLCPTKPGLSSPGRNQQRPSGEPTHLFYLD